MTDQAREWLERLHASNAPEADMALDLLGRLDELQDERKRFDDADEAYDREYERLEEAMTDVLDALGVGGPEEAIAMARTLREAFE